MKRNFSLLILCLVLICSLCYGCRKVFEYSPYSGETIPRAGELATERNIEKILRTTGESGRFSVAFLSDTHYFHDELAEAINIINQDDEVSFVVVCGDLSDQGLNEEYAHFYDQAVKLNKPLLTVIGNHDYLANAESIYGKMFGPVNYTLDYHGFRFIFFDNIFWEKNARPDFDWLDMQSRMANNEGIKPVLISHIPFFGDQYDSSSASRHVQIVKDNNITLSVHGHQHSYSYTSLSHNNKCLVVPSIGKKSYCVVTFDAQASEPVVKLKNF